MRVLISGASGMVGSNLLHTYVFDGETPAILVRREPQPNEDWDEIRWSPDDAYLDAGSLGEIDAIVHLAGEPRPGQWTLEKKAQIRNSRIRTTRLLARTAANMDPKPKVMVCASATGYYGDRGDETLDESSTPGDGFLVKVAREWETATQVATDAGIRVVHVRFGIILSPEGGALAKMLTPFKLGFGGVVGDGKQYWSWISIDDAIGAIHHAMMTDALFGPVNVVAPNPVTNHEFTKTLGRVLGRPTILPMPAAAAKLALGEMADELLLASARVVPNRLTETNYPFRHTDLEAALRHLLGQLRPIPFVERDSVTRAIGRRLPLRIAGQLNPINAIDPRTFAHKRAQVTYLLTHVLRAAQVSRIQKLHVNAISDRSERALANTNTT